MKRSELGNRQNLIILAVWNDCQNLLPQQKYYFLLVLKNGSFQVLHLKTTFTGLNELQLSMLKHVLRSILAWKSNSNGLFSKFRSNRYLLIPNPCQAWDLIANSQTQAYITCMRYFPYHPSSWTVSNRNEKNWII